MSIAEPTALLHPGKTSTIFPFLIFCSMFILVGCHVATITGCWLEFGGTIHQKNSSLSRHSFKKITLVLPSLLSATFAAVTSNYIYISLK